MYRARERKIRYSSIASMEELQRERRKLYIDIKRQEVELLEEAEMIREYFSFNSMSQIVAEKLYSKFSLFRNAMFGFRVVRSFVTRVLSRFRV